MRSLQERSFGRSKMKVIKTADIVNPEDIPSPEVIATYVHSLKMFQENNELDPQTDKLIQNLPSVRKIKRDFSNEECKLLFETVGYLWKEITGNSIIQEQDIERAPEGLKGCYWMLKNGVMLSGLNHFSIIKQNVDMFCTLLKLSPFAVHQYIASNPNKLLYYVLLNGGLRITVDQDNVGWFQLSEKTYANWARKKIKGLDLKEKNVKVIDPKTSYNGWKSGILIKL